MAFDAPLGPVFLPDPIDALHPLNGRRVGWWRMTSGLDGGRYVYDLCGLYPATLYGSALWQSTARPGGDAQLGGTSTAHGLTNDQYISAVAPDAPFLGALSIFAWLWIDGYNDASQIAGKHAGNGGSNNPFDFNFDVNGHLNLVRANGSGYFGSSSSRVVPTAGWHHVGITLADGHVDTVPTFWIDGVPETPSTTFGGGSGNATGSGAALRFGQRADASQLYGKLDDISIWSRQLSASQVQELYQLSRRGYPGVLRRMPPRLVLASSGAGPITGSGSISEAADTLTGGSASTPPAGYTYVYDSISGLPEVDPTTGQYLLTPIVSPSNSANITEAGDTASGAGTVSGGGAVSGSASIHEAGDAVVAHDATPSTPTDDVRGLAANVRALVAHIRTLPSIDDATSDQLAALDSYRTQTAAFAAMSFDSAVLAGLGRLSTGLSRIAALAA